MGARDGQSDSRCSTICTCIVMNSAAPWHPVRSELHRAIGKRQRLRQQPLSGACQPDRHGARQRTALWALSRGARPRSQSSYRLALRIRMEQNRREAVLACIAVDETLAFTPRHFRGTAITRIGIVPGPHIIRKTLAIPTNHLIRKSSAFRPFIHSGCRPRPDQV